MYLLAKAAITKYQGLGGLNNRNLFSQRSGVWKSKVRVLADLVSPEASLRWACRRPPSLSVLICPSLCAHTPANSCV